jgi:hypothetical protein
MPDRRAKIEAEHRASHGHLRAFHRDNPGFEEPVVEAMAHAICSTAQALDLITAGLFDPETFRERHGRSITPAEVHDMHLRARSHGGHPGIRSAPELIHATAIEVAKRHPHLQRRQGR